MTDHLKDQPSKRLSADDVRRIRAQLAAFDSPPKSKLLGRIGETISYPSMPQRNVISYRRGMGFFAAATFVLLLALVLPEDGRRWYFVAAAFAAAIKGGWLVSKGENAQR